MLHNESYRKYRVLKTNLLKQGHYLHLQTCSSQLSVAVNYRNTQHTLAIPQTKSVSLVQQQSEQCKNGGTIPQLSVHDHYNISVVSTVVQCQQEFHQKSQLLSLQLQRQSKRNDLQIICSGSKIENRLLTACYAGSHPWAI